jgi:hypothetical protein
MAISTATEKAIYIQNEFSVFLNRVQAWDVVVRYLVASNCRRLKAKIAIACLSLGGFLGDIWLFLFPRLFPAIRHMGLLVQRLAILRISVAGIHGIFFPLILLAGTCRMGYYSHEEFILQIRDTFLPCLKAMYGDKPIVVLDNISMIVQVYLNLILQHTPQSPVRLGGSTLLALSLPTITATSIVRIYTQLIAASVPQLDEL